MPLLLEMQVGGFDHVFVFDDVSLDHALEVGRRHAAAGIDGHGAKLFGNAGVGDGLAQIFFQFGDITAGRRRRRCEQAPRDECRRPV